MITTPSLATLKRIKGYSDAQLLKKYQTLDRKRDAFIDKNGIFGTFPQEQERSWLLDEVLNRKLKR